LGLKWQIESEGGNLKKKKLLKVMTAAVLACSHISGPSATPDLAEGTSF
jgi:hypothetical protein